MVNPANATFTNSNISENIAYSTVALVLLISTVVSGVV